MSASDRGADKEKKEELIVNYEDLCALADGRFVCSLDRAYTADEYLPPRLVVLDPSRSANSREVVSTELESLGGARKLLPLTGAEVLVMRSPSFVKEIRSGDKPQFILNIDTNEEKQIDKHLLVCEQCNFAKLKFEGREYLAVADFNNKQISLYELSALDKQSIASLKLVDFAVQSLAVVNNELVVSVNTSAYIEPKLMTLHLQMNQGKPELGVKSVFESKAHKIFDDEKYEKERKQIQKIVGASTTLAIVQVDATLSGGIATMRFGRLKEDGFECLHTAELNITAKFLRLTQEQLTSLAMQKICVIPGTDTFCFVDQRRRLQTFNAVTGQSLEHTLPNKFGYSNLKMLANGQIPYPYLSMSAGSYQLPIINMSSLAEESKAVVKKALGDHLTVDTAGVVVSYLSREDFREPELKMEVINELSAELNLNRDKETSFEYKEAKLSEMGMMHAKKAPVDQQVIELVEKLKDADNDTARYRIALEFVGNNSSHTFAKQLAKVMSPDPDLFLSARKKM